MEIDRRGYEVEDEVKFKTMEMNTGREDEGVREKEDQD